MEASSPCWPTCTDKQRGPPLAIGWFCSNSRSSMKQGLNQLAPMTLNMVLDSSQAVCKDSIVTNTGLLLLWRLSISFAHQIRKTQRERKEASRSLHPSGLESFHLTAKQLMQGQGRGLGEPGPLQKGSDHSLPLLSSEAGEKAAVVLVVEPHFHSPIIQFLRTTILTLSVGTDQKIRDRIKSRH